jgi:hypothetical protein
MKLVAAESPAFPRVPHALFAERASWVMITSPDQLRESWSPLYGVRIDPENRLVKRRPERPEPDEVISSLFPGVAVPIPTLPRPVKLKLFPDRAIVVV